MKRIITICLMLVAMVQAIGAQQEQGLSFTSLDWEVMKIDSVLPVYTEVVPLETDYRTHTYSVSLLYPEYAPLSSKEAQVAERFDSLISETIDIETFVGVERGKGLLDISFIPIRRQGTRYEKLISAQVVITANHNGRMGVRQKAGKASRYAASSKLASGKWVKVSIQEDGLYQLSRASLKKMGFGNPDNVHLYGYGGHLLPELIREGTHYDDMVEVPLYYNSQSDSWLFWGNGLIYWDGDTRVSNTFARNAYYFLTEEGAPSKMETLSYDPSLPRQTYTTTRAHTLYEKDEFAWFTGGRHLFGGENYATSNSHSYSLTANDPAGNGKLTVVFTGSDVATNKVAVTVNGTQVGNFGIDPPGDYVFATATTRNYDMTSQGTPASLNVIIRSEAGKKARLDYLAYSYDRNLSTTTKGHAYVDFSLPTGGPARFNIPGTGLKVIRTGSVKGKDALVEGTQNGNTYSIDVDDASQHYVAFMTNATFPEPTIVGNIDNQNLHSLDSLDMVIIIPTSGKLLSEARRLADAHRQYDGLRIGIVRADQIYNEFSSGTPDPTAYRLFMKMLYDKAASDDVAPRYLLLFGDCAWDNRMLSGAWYNSNPDDYLLCYESENSFSDTKSYVMEEYFGLLDDGEGYNILREKSDIGIGRFPVILSSAAKVMVDKCIEYMSRQNAGSWKNLVYFLGDDGDENEHMRYANNVAENIITKFPEMEVHKIMWDAYTRVSSANSNTYPEAQKQIKKQMRDGALVMNYTGHAGSHAFSHEYVILREDFESIKSKKLPLWVTCACDVMPFDSNNGNIGETAVLNPNGGALAFYGTTRTVFASQNYNMNRYFMQYLFSQDEKNRRNRIGDAIRLAKNSIISDGREAGYLENKLQYALLGDPALIMGNPIQKVVVDKINDKDANGTPIPLKAGERIKLTGHIEQADGTTLTNFNGIVYTRLYDSKETIVCLNNARAETPFTFTDRSIMLYESQDSVRGGSFSEEFIIPVDINFSNEDGKLVFYAIDSNSGIEANGYNEDIPIGGMVDNTDFDKDGPQIYAYLNDEGFQNGGTVNATPLFVAQLTDASGISSSGNGIGHDLSICVDGRSDLTYNINEFYVHEFGDFTRGTVAYNIPQLENGPHSITFRAWDVLNNTSQTSLDFVVDNGLPTNILRLMASQNPATTSTTFMVSYDLPGSECDFVFEVFDFSGRRIWMHEETSEGENGIFSVTWDLTNGAGSKVGTGIYLYRCYVRCGQSKWTSKTQKILVRNNK